MWYIGKVILCRITRICCNLFLTARTLLEGRLDMNCYLERMRALLYFEEVQMEVDIHRYDMENVTMTTYPAKPRLLQLKVCIYCLGTLLIV